MGIGAGLFGKHVSGRRIFGVALHAKPDGSVTATAHSSITFIGDSNTAWGVKTRFSIAGVFARSNDASIDETAGDGTITVYPDGVTWQAPGDSGAGAKSTGIGFVFLESASADMGICVCVDQATLDAVGTVEGTPLALTVSRNADFGNMAVSPCTWAHTLSKNKLSGMNNLGRDGEKTGILLNRIGQVGECDSFGNVITHANSIICMYIGINDTEQASSSEDVDAAIASLDEIVDALLSDGHIIIISTLVNNAALTNQGYAGDYNNHIRNTLAPMRNVYVVDLDSAIAGNSDYIDGLHFTVAGAAFAGQLIAQQIVALAGGAGMSNYETGTSRVVNGALSGTAGDLTGMTGAAAWDSTFTGDGTCVASKEAVSGEHDWQVYTITDGSDNDSIVATTPAMFYAGESMVCGSLDFIVSGDGCFDIDAFVTFYNAGETVSERNHACGTDGSDTNIGSREGMLYIPEIEIPTWFDHATFTFKVRLAAGDNVVKIRNAGATGTAVPI